MKDINEKVAAKYCKECLVGEAYRLLKYESYGTFMDHNFYTNDIPISTCWEIYGDNSTLRSRLLK